MICQSHIGDGDAFARDSYLVNSMQGWCDGGRVVENAWTDSEEYLADNLLYAMRQDSGF